MRVGLRHGLGIVGALLLAACASVRPTATPMPERERISDFALEARFALRLERRDEPPASAAGRLSWEHSQHRDHILLSDPLGQGIAEIEGSPQAARLRTADGKIHEAADPAELLMRATGYPLPLGELPAWLLGRPTASGRLQTDATGRPLRLFDAGWQIDYDYDTSAPEAPPARLTLRRGNDLELRLRIEEWRNAP